MMRLFVFLAWLVFGSGAAFAAVGQIGQSGNIYGNGSEGILAGTTPPPGTYVRWYNSYHATSTLRDSDGNNLPVGLKVGSFVTFPRFLFVPNSKFAGADLTLALFIPLTHIDIQKTSVNYHEYSTHLGDTDVTTVLTWRQKHSELVAGADWLFPTGAWGATNLTKPGNDEYTIMPDLGFTYYFDQKRQWNSSILSRYEHHFKKLDENVQMGDDFHFEWGAGHRLGKDIMIGPVGYAQWKVTDDSGSIDWNGHVHDHVFAAGPEIRFPLSKLQGTLEVRGLMEFDARSRTQGNGIVFTFTKRL